MTTSQTSTPTLLVPVALEALVVNTPMTEAVSFSRWQPSYDNLNKFQSPIPPPFNTELGKPSNGVYLHWVLPDTFAHGFKQTASPQAGTAAAVRATAGMTEQQEVVFPHVPNRWLVVRIVPGTATATGTCRAWIVQSDYLGSQSSPGTNPFVDPFQSTSSSVVTTTLGKTVDLENWVEPAAAQLFLKAVGPATVTFSAYTPNVQDVFSVYDDLSDLRDLPKDPYDSGTNLTYVVMGWYSDPTEDLLYGKSQYGANGWTTADQWMALMQDLNWAIPAGADQLPAASLPKQSLCHGMIYAVQWQTKTVPDRVNSDPTKLQVAVGNKGIDAFTALLESVAQNSGTTINPELMEAFQYSLLPEINQPDGAAQVALKAEQAWFASTPGGTLWQIVAAQRADLTQTNQPQPQITPAQAAALAQLNQAQVQLDQNRRQLESLQSQLHDIWWKNQFLSIGTNNPPPGEKQLTSYNWSTIQTEMQTALNPAASGSLAYRVKQLQAQISNQVAALPDPHNSDSIAHYATTVMGLPPTLQLNPVAQPRFYQPSDPVLMIGGMEWPDRYIYGGVSDPTAALLTRLGDQTITGLTVDNQTVTVSQISQFIPMLPSTQQGKLPPRFVNLMVALLQEAFLLDTDSAVVIAAHMSGPTLSDIVTAIGSYVSGDAVNQTPAANVPATLAVMPWQQAWSPLFLEWSATYLPTPNTTSTPGVVNWQFNETESDYDWPPPNTGNSTDPVAQTYSGRIFLSPHITFGFIARLKQYLQDHPNDPNSPGLQAIQKLIDQIGEWNFLSQTLSGFNDFLIMQNLDVTMPPDDSILPQLGDQYDSFPYTAPGAAPGNSWDVPVPANYFFPIRAGHFYFQELQVVDRFGQVLPLLQANNNPTGNYESFYPIQGNGLVPNSNYSPAGPVPPSARSYLRQPPRFIQTSRLEFNFVSATNDQQRSDLYADASPVCGWVLPNHLDQSLAIYDATGKLLGELLQVENNQGQNTLIWQPDPGDASPIAPPQISNPHLQGFVQQLLNLNDQGKGFEALLQVIDATLWKVDPLSGRGDENLSVLIGRPLALVRAELQLMLENDPVQDQSWNWTCGVNPLHETPFDFTQVQFNVRLGSLDLFDDGLLGYFNSDNYGQFNSVHSPTSATPYIAPIGENNYITLPPNYLSQPAAQQTTKFVTLLLDPRGTIHATTGILPTQTVTLPDAYVGDAIKDINVTFRVNGLLTDPDTIRIPIPALKHADWSWIERSDPNTWNTTLPIVKANQKPRLVNTPAVIHEGWLKLVDKEDGTS